MKILVVFALAFSFSVHAFAAKQAIDVTVDEAGYTPAEIKVPAGSTVELRLVRTTDDTCAKEIVIPSLKINKPLPLNKRVVVVLPNLKSGQVKFGCHMDQMLGGAILVH